METIAEQYGDQASHEAQLRSRGLLPWQLWVVTAFLGMEGILGNLPMIPSHPVAAIWLLFKCLFVAGFFLRWRFVYILYIVIGVFHVFAFAVSSPVVALLNLALVLLVASSKRHFFEAKPVNA